MISEPRKLQSDRRRITIVSSPSVKLASTYEGSRAPMFRARQTTIDQNDERENLGTVPRHKGCDFPIILLEIINQTDATNVYFMTTTCMANEEPRTTDIVPIDFSRDDERRNRRMGAGFAEPSAIKTMLRLRHYIYLCAANRHASVRLFPQP